jgi:poly-gamma-glutamate synthesis protein (capsule biosynthesis protein)
MEIDEKSLICLAFVGDVALGNHPKTPGFGFYSKYMGGIPHQMAHRVLPPSLAPDLVFGNLEFSLAPHGDRPGTDICCLGSDIYIPFLREVGFTILNVANNHAWEHGAARFRETVRSLRNAGIKVVGVPEDFDPSGFLRIKGKTIAVLGCSSRPRQGFTSPPDYNEFQEVLFLERIRHARGQADAVCVSIHWGEEFLPIPSPEERRIAHAMVDAGASVVVGHHSHVLREVENYGNGVIAYSLGNFIGDMIWNPLTRETGCLAVVLEDSRIRTSTFFPGVINDLDYFPQYLDEQESLGFMETDRERRACLNVALDTYGYEFLAREALQRHQRLTLGFLLKNLFRYRAASLARIASHAIRIRLRGGNT